MALQISSLTSEYVRTLVHMTAADVVVDPSADVVSFAFVTQGANPSAWFTGSWENSITADKYARVLVGPGQTANPGVGEWAVWIKIVAGSETIVRYVDNLIIT